MLGCRALSNSEIALISKELSLRNRCIFILGIRTGFRIRELLSLNVGDVLDADGSIRDAVKVQRCNMKGSQSSRVMPMHDDAKALLREYLAMHMQSNDATAPLFRSTGTGGKKPGRLEYTVFRKALKKALTRASIRDSHLVGTHSMRKSFANNMNELVEGNIYKLQKLMGHKDISSTAKYISVDEDELFKLVLKQRSK